MQAATMKTTEPEGSDTELAQRIAAGDRQAFVLLMRRYNRSLYRTARSILRDDAEAEDAVQEAYLLVFRKIGDFRGDARLSTWLTRIVVNEAITRARRSTRRAQVIRLDGQAEWDKDSSEMDTMDASTDTPEQAAMRTQMRLLLEKAIDDLPDAFRTVFVLRALEEMSGEEVSVCLDIPLATVRSRFFRARGLLRTALSSEIDVASRAAFSFDGARCDRLVAGVLERLGPSPSGHA